MLTTSKCNITFFRLTLKTYFCLFFAFSTSDVLETLKFTRFFIWKVFAAIIMRSPVSMQPCLWTSPALVTCSTPPPQGKNTRTQMSKGVANLLHARPQQRGRKCDLTCRRYMRCCKFAQIWNFTPFIYIFRIDNLRAISWFYRWWCLINSVWVLFG